MLLLYLQIFLNQSLMGKKDPEAIALGMARAEVYMISSFPPGSSCDPALLILTLLRHNLLTHRCNV